MIRLLSVRQFNGETIPAGAVVDVFDAATEAALIAAKEAMASVAAATWKPADRAYKPLQPIVGSPADQALFESLASGDGNFASADVPTVQGAYIGDTRRIADGSDRGALLIWAVPEGSSAPAWCWWLWPQSAYTA